MASEFDAVTPVEKDLKQQLLDIQYVQRVATKRLCELVRPSLSFKTTTRKSLTGSAVYNLGTRS